MRVIRKLKLLEDGTLMTLDGVVLQMTGEVGADGYTPIKGVDYFDGEQGPPGVQGDDGPPGTTTWAGITDKPSVFPPDVHGHAELHSNALDHAAGSDNQDLSALVNTNDSRLSDARTPTTHGHATSEVTGLDTALSGKEAANSNIQAHVTAAHAPSNAQKNSDILKTEIEAVLTGEITSHSHAGSVASHESTYNHGNYNTAYTHSQAAHAPSGAQVNADITKAEIEAKLTGTITSHSHSGGSDPFMAKLVLGADKPTGANTTPVTLGLSFNYEANSKYVIDLYAMVQPAAAGTGCAFPIDVSSAVTYVAMQTNHQLALTGTLSGASSVGDLGATANGTSSGMPNATAIHPVVGQGMLITGANAGTATFFFRSETTAVTTCKAGSMIRVQKLA
jgi:hypothetical protein